MCPSTPSPGALLQPDSVYPWKHVLLKHQKLNSSSAQTTQCGGGLPLAQSVAQGCRGCPRPRSLSSCRSLPGQGGCPQPGAILYSRREDERTGTSALIPEKIKPFQETHSICFHFVDQDCVTDHPCLKGRGETVAPPGAEHLLVWKGQGWLEPEMQQPPSLASASCPTDCSPSGSGLPGPLVGAIIRTGQFDAGKILVLRLQFSPIVSWNHSRGGVNYRDITLLLLNVFYFIIKQVALIFQQFQWPSEISFLFPISDCRHRSICEEKSYQASRSQSISVSEWWLRSYNRKRMDRPEAKTLEETDVSVVKKVEGMLSHGPS